MRHEGTKYSAVCTRTVTISMNTELCTSTYLFHAHSSFLLFTWSLRLKYDTLFYSKTGAYNSRSIYMYMYVYVAIR